jgi:hypothetical protein
LTSKQAKNQLPSNSILANALVMVIGAIVITFSFLVGLVALLALGAAAVIIDSIVAVRFWWLRRQAGGPGNLRRPAGGRSAERVIEGEFRVVDGESAPVDRSET